MQTKTETDQNDIRTRFASSAGNLLLAGKPRTIAGNREPPSTTAIAANHRTG
ncbi:hypothetical protein HanXRQr2_Chr12g0550971 [Helianthus annuus]|uniref:Uncharacterized protein n=1 Tax=Helianthus annuus TaxID=4232 RepID=A0A251T4B9_HELAN|nr:hypothetical protein HanXRQr2_Chr12g0550971 [Helianthus annuus]KAJ0863478.1 hypothetical protein HanPSC8_Chr12g0530471 [Helianthus annuus]